MRIDDDRDLAEQVESALRALGIASTRTCSERSDRIIDAVSALRAGAGLRRIEVIDEAMHEGEEQR